MSSKTPAGDIQLWPLEAVQPYAKNAKVHGKAQVAQIAASIKKLGWRGNPIVVNEQGVILAGHGRRLAAIELGLKKVPVLVAAGMTPAEQNAYRLADNRVAISGYDTDLLQAELKELDFDMEGIFDKKELAFLDADLGEINADAFVEDLDGALDAQAAETDRTINEADEKDVPIAKALGFKSIKGRDERTVAMFMAQIEAETGEQGAAAFLAFLAARK
jgi:ParB-like chromosome segregation protein Spo0J